MLFICKRLSSHKCLLLVCDEGSADGPRSLYIYERWCPLVLTIQQSKVNNSANMACYNTKFGLELRFIACLTQSKCTTCTQHSMTEAPGFFVSSQKMRGLMIDSVCYRCSWQVGPLSPASHG